MVRKNQVCILLLLFLQMPVENSWVLRKNENNISIFTKEVATSDFQEVKCTTTVQASLSSIVKGLTVADHYSELNYNLIEATTIKQISESDSYSYQRFT